MEDNDEVMEELADQVEQEVEDTVAEAALGGVKRLRDVLKRRREAAMTTLLPPGPAPNDVAAAADHAPVSGLLRSAHARAQKTYRLKKSAEMHSLKQENQTLKTENRELKDELLRMLRGPGAPGAPGVEALASGMRALMPPSGEGNSR